MHPDNGWKLHVSMNFCFSLCHVDPLERARSLSDPSIEHRVPRELNALGFPNLWVFHLLYSTEMSVISGPYFRAFLEVHVSHLTLNTPLL